MISYITRLLTQVWMMTVDRVSRLRRPRSPEVVLSCDPAIPILKDKLDRRPKESSPADGGSGLVARLPLSLWPLKTIFTACELPAGP
jgi:hypothetical protein